MVGEHLDDPALGDAFPFALLDHPLELDFQGLQPGDAALDALELPERNPVRRLAGPVGLVRSA